MYYFLTVTRPTPIKAIFLLLGLSLIGKVAGAEDDATAIISKAFEAARSNEKATRNYVFHERLEERRFNRKGKEKKRESKTWDVTLLDRSQYRQLIARNDQALSARETAKEKRKLLKSIKKTKVETPKQRRKRLAQLEEDQRKDHELLREITRAFDFRLLRKEAIDGVSTHVISAEPRPGYKPASRETRVLRKIRATLWVAQDDYGFVQADIETIDNFTWAAVFKLREGARVQMKQRRHQSGIWLAEYWQIRFRAKVAQLMRFNREFTSTFSNYRRFGTETTETWSVE